MDKVSFSFDILEIGKMVDDATQAYDDAAAEADRNPSQAAFTRAAHAMQAMHQAEDRASNLIKMLQD